MHASRSYFNKQAIDKQAFIWWYEALGLLFFSPVFLVAWFHSNTTPILSLPFIMLSGVVHFIYWYFLSRALDKGDLSLVYPIMRSSPAVVLVFSVFILGEYVSLLGVFGILMVASGVYTINLSRISRADLLRPFRNVRRDRAVWFALLTMISAAGYTLVDKMAVSRMNPIIFAYIYPWISLGLFTGHIYQSNKKAALRKEWNVHKGQIAVCGFLSIFGYFLILLAFTMERMSYIVGLRQLSIVIAVFLGGHFLKEKNKMIRLTSSLIIFAGAYLIAVAD